MTADLANSPTSVSPALIPCSLVNKPAKALHLSESSSRQVVFRRRSGRVRIKDAKPTSRSLTLRGRPEPRQIERASRVAKRLRRRKSATRIPVSLRYFENPEGRAPVTLLFCEVRKLASPEASRPRSRCSRPRKPRTTGPRRPIKLLSRVIGTCVLRDCAGQSGHVLPPRSDVRTLLPWSINAF